MSGQATGWVLRHGPAPEMLDRHGKPYGGRSRGLRAVLVVVADAANLDGQYAHPGIENVASGALYGRRQSVKLLAELVADGWLVVERQGGGRGVATVYSLRMDTPRNGDVSAPFPEGETVHSTPLNSALCDTETVHSETETVHSRVHPDGLTTLTPNGLPTRASTDADDAGFDAFWKLYPMKKAKLAARAAWAKAVKRAPPETIIEGVPRYCAELVRGPLTIPALPATWLNGERWTDEDAPALTREPKAFAAIRSNLERNEPRPPEPKELEP